MSLLEQRELVKLRLLEQATEDRKQAAADLARLVIATFDGIQLQWLYDKSVDMGLSLRGLIEVLLAPR